MICNLYSFAIISFTKPLHALSEMLCEIREAERRNDYSEFFDTIRTCQQSSKLISDLGVEVGELIQDRNFGEWTENCLFSELLYRRIACCADSKTERRSEIYSVGVIYEHSARLLPVQKGFVTGWLGNRMDNPSKCTQFFLSREYRSKKVSKSNIWESRQKWKDPAILRVYYTFRSYVALPRVKAV